jgi:hypothetical protein
MPNSSPTPTEQRIAARLTAISVPTNLSLEERVGWLIEEYQWQQAQLERVIPKPIRCRVLVAV